MYFWEEICTYRFIYHLSIYLLISKNKLQLSYLYQHVHKRLNGHYTYELLQAITGVKYDIKTWASCNSLFSWHWPHILSLYC